MDLVAGLEEIEYMEKPKRFFYSVTNPADAACLPGVTLKEPFLTGEGVLVAVLDYPVLHIAERISERKTEIPESGFYGTRPSCPPKTGSCFLPEGFSMGVEFCENQINEALRASTEEAQYETVPSRDVSGHGTAVAGIAAGSAVMGGLHRGTAPGADLLIVKLGTPDRLGFPRTTEIMRGVTYALQKAQLLAMPLVINLSFGNSYGAHDGSSLLERFLDNAAEIGRTVICVGSGNEGNARGHVAGNVEEAEAVELAVGEYETTLNVQIWQNYSDKYRISLRSPGGQEEVLPQSVEGGKYTLRLEQTEILVYMGEPTPLRSGTRDLSGIQTRQAGPILTAESGRFVWSLFQL